MLIPLCLIYIGHFLGRVLIEGESQLSSCMIEHVKIVLSEKITGKYCKVNLKLHILLKS